MKKFFDGIPKFVLGPLAVILGIFYLTQQDPPKTICDTQFEIFRNEKNAAKYIFPTKKKKIEISPGIKKDIEMCQDSNNSGGCFDWMEGLKKTLKLTRNIPEECRDRIDELEPLKKWLDQSLFVYSQISWNNATVVRRGLFHWLEQDDIMLFCRLKQEYIRIVGPKEYKSLEKKLVQDLVTLKKLPMAQVWERTVLSYKCPVLN